LANTSLSPQAFANKIRTYNSIVINDSVAKTDDLVALSRCLAQLLDMAETLPPGFTDCEYEPEKQDRKIIEEIISKRFVDFGFYSSADPAENAVGREEALGISDAVDDLVEIHADLNEALVYFDKGVPNNMFWHAKLMFGHWGTHAIELKRYLHKRLHDW